MIRCDGCLFQTTLDYNGHLFSSDFILWFGMLVVYFQTILDY